MQAHDFSSSQNDGANIEVNSQNDGANIEGEVLKQTLWIYEMKALKYNIIFLLLSS